MTFVGAMIWFETGEKEAAIGCLVFGPLMVGGLLYLLRKQHYARYVEARELVTPLARDVCPYCQSPLFAAARPRCHTCKVEILGA
jgi:hypothetical protein